MATNKIEDLFAFEKIEALYPFDKIFPLIDGNKRKIKQWKEFLFLWMINDILENGEFTDAKYGYYSSLMLPYIQSKYAYMPKNIKSCLKRALERFYSDDGEDESDLESDADAAEE